MNLLEHLNADSSVLIASLNLKIAQLEAQNDELCSKNDELKQRLKKRGDEHESINDHTDN